MKPDEGERKGTGGGSSWHYTGDRGNFLQDVSFALIL